MNIKVVAIGAAGGKAAINLIEKGVLSQDRIMILNSTLRDIPESYRHLATQLSGGKGCGKERELSKQLCLKSIKDETLAGLDSFVNPEDELVIIVSSTAGGTGSGSAPIIAKYFRDIVDIAVQCFAFTGFEEDGRELQNTIEYFQEMSDEFTVEAISNKKFLEGSNKLKAEKAANDEFVRRVAILMGRGLIDSDQNIDETDLYKVATTEGYMTVLSTELANIKNIDQFNKAISLMLDEEKALEVSEKSIKRLAAFINAPEKMYDFIDYNFTLVKERLGTPYEVFTHVQYNEDMPVGISFIASGMKMPIEEVKDIYEKYKKESEKVNKTKDNFFDFASELRGNQEDGMFNVSGRKQKSNKSKLDFLKEMSEEPIEEIPKEEPKKESPFKNTNVKQIKKDDFIKNNF